jgi:PST family polysaccharide transporter
MTRSHSSHAASGRLGRAFLLGGLYVGAGSWATTIFRFVVNLLIARILGPETLGFYAFVFSVNELLNMVGAFSMGLALIQSPRSSPRHADTALLIAAALGLAGLVAAAAVAPFLYIYRSPDSAVFILLLGVVRFVALVGAIPMAIIERELRYGVVAGINVAAGVLPSVTALLLAWLGAGAWSLLAQDLLIATTILCLGLPLSRYRFQRAFDRQIARRLMAFGRPMFASRSLEIALQRIDRLLVGGFMGDMRLGFYHQARVLAETGLIVGNPLQRLVFNLYARIQNDPVQLARAFGLINYFLVRLMFAGATTLLVFPEQTIRLLLGERWVEAAPILGALAAYAALLPVFENTKQLFYGRGEVRRSVAVRLVQLALLCAGLGVAIVLDDAIIVAGVASAVAAVGVLLGFLMNRDVARGVIRESFLGPAAAVACTWIVLKVQPFADIVVDLPYFVLPFLPPLICGALVVALERTVLMRKLQSLRHMLKPQTSEAGSP